MTIRFSDPTVQQLRYSHSLESYNAYVFPVGLLQIINENKPSYSLLKYLINLT